MPKSSSLKIVHVLLSRDFGGSERYCASLAQEQVRLGHDVLVVGLKQAKGVSLAAMLGKIPFVALPLVGKKAAIAGILRQFEADVVHCHLGKASRLVGGLRKRPPAVATLHINYKAKNYARMDGLIAVAEHQLRGMEDYSGKTAVIGNWLIAPDEMPARVQDEQFTFGVIARLHEMKGIDVLIRSFKRLSGDYRLLIVGSGDETRALQALAAGDERIAFVGHVQDPWPYYAQIDCFVSTARKEAFGLTLVEAMHAGCRMIASKTDGALEALKAQPVQWVEVDDEAGVLAAMQEAEALPVPVYDLQRFEVGGLVGRILDFYCNLRG